MELLRWLDTPADLDDCQRILARLKVLTRERNLSQDDLVAQIAIYAEELSRYPLDVVRSACRDWAAQEKWFPAWAELRAACDDGAMKRRGLLRAIERHFETPR